MTAPTSTPRRRWKASVTELVVLNDPLQTDLTDPAALAERDALVGALDAIDASPEAVAVADQQVIVDGLQAEVDDLTDATSEESLRAALLAAANANRVEAAGGDAYLTPGNHGLGNRADRRADGCLYRAAVRRTGATLVRGLRPLCRPTGRLPLDFLTRRALVQARRDLFVRQGPANRRPLPSGKVAGAEPPRLLRRAP